MKKQNKRPFEGTVQKVKVRAAKNLPAYLKSSVDKTMSVSVQTAELWAANAWAEKVGDRKKAEKPKAAPSK